MGPLFDQQQLMVNEPGLWPLLKSHGYLPPGNADEAASLLDRAGDHWFSNVSDSFSRLLQEEEPEQLLYSSLMEALGYSQNRQPFLDLAHRVPYSRLLRAALKVPRSERRLTIQNTLLKAAGFPAAPSQTISTNTLGWHLFRVRPQNHPRRRIMGFARVLDLFLPGEAVSPTREAQGTDGRFEPGAWTFSRPSVMGRSRQATADTMGNNEDAVPPWANLGLVTGMAQLVSSGTERGDDHRRYKVLEAGLMGMGSHPSRKDTLAMREGNLIGSARARDMAVNCVLPFLHALGRMSDDYPLAEAALELYRRFPKLQGNEITKEMWHRLFAPLRNAHSTNPPYSEAKGWEPLVCNARRQQGLLHLHHLLTSLGTFSSR